MRPASPNALLTNSTSLTWFSLSSSCHIQRSPRSTSQDHLILTPSGLTHSTPVSNTRNSGAGQQLVLTNEHSPDFTASMNFPEADDERNGGICGFDSGHVEANSALGQRIYVPIVKDNHFSIPSTDCPYNRHSPCSSVKRSLFSNAVLTDNTALNDDADFSEHQYHLLEEADGSGHTNAIDRSSEMLTKEEAYCIVLKDLKTNKNSSNDLDVIQYDVLQMLISRIEARNKKTKFLKCLPLA